MHDEPLSHSSRQSSSNDEFTYDVFISYSSKDQAWVRGPLLQRLEAHGLRVCIDVRDFRPGAPIVTEMDRAVISSRKTLVVLTPDFLTSDWTEFEEVLTLTIAKGFRQRRLIPLIKVPCNPPSRIGALVSIDFTDPTAHEFAYARLLTTLDPALAERQMEQTPLDTVPKPGLFPPGSRMPFAHNPLFVGREGDLCKLAQLFKLREIAAIGQVEIVAVTGLGGIGKTQLAVEFVHRYGQYFTGGVFWLSFADAAAIPSEVAACGSLEGMHLSDDFSKLPLNNQVQLVLAEWRSSLPRLLVFDNCEDEALLDEWRPKYGGCRVLVTSRRAQWDRALGVHPLALGELPRNESLVLLRSFREFGVEDDAILDAIADELGDLPLALHLAGSFLDQEDMTVQEYLDELCKTTVIAHESLEGAGISPTKHDLSVARTFHLSYDRLATTDPIDALAVGILACAAYFAPGELIPQDLLRATLELASSEQHVNRQVTQGIRRLVVLGLLDEEANGAVRLHRLVAVFVQAIAPSATAQMAVEQAMVNEVTKLYELRKPHRITPIEQHLRAVTDAARVRMDERAARLCDVLGQHLWTIGNYPGSQPYLERALEIRKQANNQNDHAIIQTLNLLGMVLHAEGTYAGARTAFEQALMLCDRGPTRNDRDTVQILNNLGYTLHAQRELNTARMYLERALEIGVRVLGEFDPDTAQTLDNLGIVYRDSGNLVEARLYLDRALTIREQVLGPEDADTAWTLGSLGRLLIKQGEYGAAERYFTRALAINKLVLGERHPYTGWCFWELASLRAFQGDRAGALFYYKCALPIFAAWRGATHASTQKIQAEIAALSDNPTRNVVE